MFEFELVLGSGLVTAQVEGMGIMAGPPARGPTCDVGSAAQRAAEEMRMAVAEYILWL